MQWVRSSLYKIYLIAQWESEHSYFKIQFFFLQKFHNSLVWGSLFNLEIFCGSPHDTAVIFGSLINKIFNSIISLNISNRYRLVLILINTTTKNSNIWNAAYAVLERYLPCLAYIDRLCGLVVRVSGYRYRGLGFDPRRYQIFRVAVGLERGALSLVSLVRSIEELLE